MQCNGILCYSVQLYTDIWNFGGIIDITQFFDLNESVGA